jgi:thioredoxin-related protein
MKRVVLALALVAMIGYVAWTKLQTQPARLTAALEQAKKEQKLVLLDFTGSDWCGWCQKLDAEVLGKPEFIDYAAKYLITVVVDFPMHHDLAPDLKKANNNLKGKFEVTGYPTLVALSPEGKVVWKQAGYVEGGAFSLIAPLNRTRMALGLPAPPESELTNTIAMVTDDGPEKPASSISLPGAAVAVSTRPLPTNAPKLQGIFYSGTNSSVILGGWHCGEGDTVAGMRVLKIWRNKVLVEWQGRTHELEYH